MLTLLQRIKRFVYAEKINGQRFINALTEDIEDVRDFKTRVLGWGGYTPLHQRLILPTQSIKNQGGYGTCQWNATAVQKEGDEKVVLSVESIVAYARSKDLAGAEGLSSLKSGQLVLRDFGISEDSLLPNPNMNDYDAYSNGRILTPVVIENAATHKSKTFWQVIGRNDILRLLDQGKIPTTGMMWYSGFNMGGGFSAPWLIIKNVGVEVMGHAFVMIGYDLNYMGRQVYIFQNSYGKEWGDEGKFYIEMNFFDQVGYSRWANLDISYDIGTFLTAYDGHNVKGAGPGIYYILNGQKCPFPDWLTFLAYGNLKGSYDKVDDGALSQIPAGPPMDITQSTLWPIIKDMSAPDNYNKLLEIIAEKKV